ncbi:phytoene/squalene synthase [Streptomyces sp. NBRC 110611]|uniref:squalene/phytoene synthase family protein n=1 Tax=Streptomyces sp. NBRC 110611 TaxID=1621259 RepID=UPI000836F4F8|nr:squalene/phytoene synthase family protein [Streptomyces sp. NBRC 110611]GAU69136.1 phytoene/squalene synthase [Streptomyces sp. NBRC 110611]
MHNPSAADARDVLKATSRTFFLPIDDLPPGLRETVMAAYLTHRAIDEIEDHPELEDQAKDWLLSTLSAGIRAAVGGEDFMACFGDAARQLPEVTLRLDEWLALAPADIAPRVWETTASMAERMASWARSHWRIRTPADLCRYTFDVAGSIGLLLCDVHAWYDGTIAPRAEAVAFGRGLQSVNIALDVDKDRARGQRFLPDGWGTPDLLSFARVQLARGRSYQNALPPGGPAHAFTRIPLELAWASLRVIEDSGRRLTRPEVEEIVAKARAGV